MSAYNRFVAYVYEYQKGKKGLNRGFLKVEVRNGLCTIDIHLKIPGLAPGLSCKTYGFLRTSQKIYGVLLGQCTTQDSAIESSLETKEKEMGKGGFSLSDFGGMILLPEGGGFYGTEWDDLPIVPGDFTENEPEPSSPESEPEPEPKPDPVPLPPVKDSSEEPVPSAAQPQPVSEERREKEEETPLQMETEEIRKACKEPCRMETFHPFDDDEVIDCKKITPRDFHCLGRKDWALKNNRFLLYGYYNFGHLLIGRLSSSGQYILGVPGICDQQERFMANMFGFPHFKCSRHLEIAQGRGGYWYRCICPPSAF